MTGVSYISQYKNIDTLFLPCYDSVMPFIHSLLVAVF